MENKKRKRITIKPAVQNELAETMTVQNSSLAFEYGGHHFIPIGIIDKTQTLKELSKVIASDKRMGMWVASYCEIMGKNKIDWSYEAFYSACGNIACDVFKCLDNCKLYMPGSNELFLYKGKYMPFIKSNDTSAVDSNSNI